MEIPFSNSDSLVTFPLFLSWAGFSESSLRLLEVLQYFAFVPPVGGNSNYRSLTNGKFMCDCSLLCSAQGLTLTYQKMLVLPMPDYAHRYSLWRSLIVEAGGLILKWSDRFDLSSLTKVSDGYTGLVSTIKYRSESLT